MSAKEYETYVKREEEGKKRGDRKMMQQPTVMQHIRYVLDKQRSLLCYWLYQLQRKGEFQAAAAATSAAAAVILYDVSLSLHRLRVT